MLTIRHSFLLVFLLSTPAFAVTGGQLRTDLRLRLGQTSASNSNWTDAQLYRILNEAQDYISAVGRVVEKMDTLPGGSLRISIDTSMRYISLRGASYLWRNGAEVKPIPLVSTDSMARIMDRMNSQSFGVDKYVISEEGGKLIVAPTLNSADSVVVSFYAFPAAIDTAVECQYDAAWEEVLRLAAKVIALEKISSPDLPLAIQERDKLLSVLYGSDALKPQMRSTAP